MEPAMVQAMQIYMVMSTRFNPGFIFNQDPPKTQKRPSSMEWVVDPTDIPREQGCIGSVRAPTLSVWRVCGLT